ncbi:MAG: sensor histidine kinase, partial [Alphaproteobacteria bacterium]
MFGEIKFRPPRLAKSLSARLLVLTIFFVMLAELLIYAPSLANFRQTWLEDKLAAAHLSILSLEAIPEDMISDEVKEALLTHVDAHAVVLKKPDRRLLLYTKKPPTIEVTVDLEDRSSMMLIGDAFATLVQSRNRIMRLLGPSPRDPGLGVEVVLDEADLR